MPKERLLSPSFSVPPFSPGPPSPPALHPSKPRCASSWPLPADHPTSPSLFAFRLETSTAQLLFTPFFPLYPPSLGERVRSVNAGRTPFLSSCEPREAFRAGLPTFPIGLPAPLLHPISHPLDAMPDLREILFSIVFFSSTAFLRRRCHQRLPDSTGCPFVFISFARPPPPPRAAALRRRCGPDAGHSSTDPSLPFCGPVSCVEKGSAAPLSENPPAPVLFSPFFSPYELFRPLERQPWSQPFLATRLNVPRPAPDFCFSFSSPLRFFF